MKTTVSDYWEHFPIHTVLDGVIVSQRGDLTVGWEISLPETGTIDRDSIEHINRKFSEAVRLLPPWMLVHRQDIYSGRHYIPDEEGGFLKRSYEEHFAGRPYLEHRQLLFLTLSSRGAALLSSSDSGLWSFIPEGFKGAGERTGQLQAAAGPFIGKVTEASDISARELGNAELIGLLEDYRRLYRPEQELTDLQYTPDSVIQGEDILWSWNVSESKDLSRMMYSSRPAELWSGKDSRIYTSSAAAIGPLLDCEHVVNTLFMTVRQDKMMNEVEIRKRRMTSLSKHSMVNTGNAEELQEFQQSVHRDDSTMVLCHMDVMVKGDDSIRVKVQSYVSSALSSMGISTVRNTIDTPVVWYSMMPGAEGELGKEHYMKMELEGAMCLNINETFTHDMKGGLLKFGDRIRKVPVRLDFQEAALNAGLITNYNAFILGESGAGKSFFTNLMTRSFYDAGQSILIIDIGGSYKGLCSIINEESGGVDGQYHDWGAEEKISFDAFWDFGSWLDGDGNLRHDCDGLRFVQSLLHTIWRPEQGWNGDNTAILMRMLQDFAVSWDKDRKPVFDDFTEFISGPVQRQVLSAEGYRLSENNSVHRDRFDTQKFVTALGDYSTGGIYGFLLNNPDPADLMSSRFTVFEVSSLVPNDNGNYSIIYQVVVLCIMTAMNSKMKTEQGYKTMIIEEAWKAIANETMSGFLTSLWKTARKYQTSAIVVTQQISDIMSSGTIKDTIMQNSGVKVLLKQAGNRSNMDDICQLMGLSAHERAMVESMHQDPSGYREVFITLGGKHSGVYTTEVSPQEVIAYESQLGRKKEFLELAETEGYIGAIRTLTQKR